MSPSKHARVRQFRLPTALIIYVVPILSLLASFSLIYWAITLPNHRSSLLEIKARPVDCCVAAIWAAATAFRTYYNTEILLGRHSFLSPLELKKRALGLLAVAVILYQALGYIFGAEQPVHTWLILACISELIHVSMNVRFRIAAKRSKSPFKSERPALLAACVGWPLALAGLVSTLLFLFADAKDKRYFFGHQPVALGPKTSLAELGAIDNANVKLLMIVLTSWTPHGFKKRQAFRESTLRLVPPSSDHVSLAYRFILGGVPSYDVEKEMGPKIVEENCTYSDLVFVPTSDRYEDLSYKVYEALKWAKGFDFDYLIKTDDDMFVRMDTVTKELMEMKKTPWYWRGLGYWNIPPIKDHTSKNAELEYPLSVFPPFVAGALYILSSDIIDIVATDTPRLFMKNEDQNMGIWLFPYGIKPIHDRRILQMDSCEDDMIAKHFSDSYEKEMTNDGSNKELTMKDMYKNVEKGVRPCEGFRQQFCALCYPCYGRSNHWRDWGFDCDEQKGITVRDIGQNAQPDYMVSGSDYTMEIDVRAPIFETADDWIIPGLLSTTSSVLSLSENWHLLHWVCWTTSASTWKDSHYGTIDLIFAHTPRAVVIVLSDSLPKQFFAPYTDQGYRIHVVSINRERIIERKWYLGPNTKSWLDNWKDWEAGPTFYSHLTDYMRYLVLYKYGGVYMDMDALWLRSPPYPNDEFIGGDYSVEDDDYPWTLDDKNLYTAPGVMRFRKGWRAFREISESSFSSLYSPDCFNCVGPRAITVYVKKHRDSLERHGFKILEKDVLYPISYPQIHKLLKSDPKGPEEAKRKFQKIATGSWSLHLYGHVSNKLAIEPDSVVDLALRHFHLGIPKTAVPSPALSLQSPAVIHLAPHSLFKKFDGLDLIFLRGGPSNSNNGITVLVKAERGKLSWGLDGEAATLAALYDLGKTDLNTNTTLPYGTPSKFAKDEIFVEGVALKMVVNSLLNTLVYYPPFSERKNSKTDVVRLEIAYGGQKVVGLVDIFFESVKNR